MTAMKTAGDDAMRCSGATAAIFALLSAAAVAVPVPARAWPGPSQDEAVGLRGGVDAEAMGEAALEILRAYLRIDTVNPPGNEIRGAEFFARRLEREDVPFEIIESSPGRANLYARLEGDGSRGGALVLLHHIDVVPADARYWTADPFGAEIRDGFVIGRGAVDMKGYGAVQLATFLALNRADVRLGRDVVFLATAGEETGGEAGAGYLVENRPDLFADVDFLLTEGATTEEIDGRTVHSVEVAHKTPAWLRLTVTGPAGHGSRPRADAATHRLVRALERIRTYRGELELVEPVARALRARARYEPDPALAEAYRNIEESFQDPAILEALTAEIEPLLRNTISITVLEGSSKTNVLPPVAAAELDCRLLPGEDPARFIATLRDVIDDPAVEIEPLLVHESTESPSDTPLWRAIEEAARAADPDAVVVPTVIPGFTDAHWFRRMGVVAYGWAPFVRRAEEGPAHGTDEKIHAENVQRGPALLYDVITRLAALPEG